MRSSNCQDAHAPKTPSLETPEGPLFEPGLLSVILSTLTGEHDSRRHRSSENHCCNGLHYGRRARSLQPLLRAISSCLP